MQQDNSIANLVKFHRQKSGLTQNQLAQLAGTGKTVVFDIEKGKQTVQVDTLLKVLGVLNIKIVFDSPLMETYMKELKEKSHKDLNEESHEKG